jgi:leucyl aminopeptidase
MQIQAIKTDLKTLKADLLVLAALEAKKFGAVSFLPGHKAANELILKEMKETGFTGREGQMLVVPLHGLLPIKRVLLVGVGEMKKINFEKIRRFGAMAARRAGELKQKKVLAVLPAQGKDASRAFTEGVILGLYRYNKYHDEKRKRKEEHGIETVIIAASDAIKVRLAEIGIENGLKIAQGTVLARDLVNEPASIATPAHLSEHARRIAKESKGVSVEIYNREQCRKMGMGAFLAVAEGATEEPYFIHLKYKPKIAKKKIVIVGKGITFDSGGLQTKPGDSMATMKCDMSGAAAVLGLFSVIADLAPRAEVHGVIAATENMPGKNAYKPGDIVRAMNGTTIEVGHTDAEGRVTMADALSFAAAKKPDMIIDLATLTGACVVALGEEFAGLMSNDRRLAEKLKNAAALAGENIWELPLPREYAPLVKSDVAQIKNVSRTRYGGTLTAGLFLENFVSETPWAHLDIAGPAYAERETVPYIPKGGSGFGVRTLIRFLADF